METNQETNELHVLRGGSWHCNPYYLRASNRNRNAPINRNYDLGFRCAEKGEGECKASGE